MNKKNLSETHTTSKKRSPRSKKVVSDFTISEPYILNQIKILAPKKTSPKSKKKTLLKAKKKKLTVEIISPSIQDSEEVVPIKVTAVLEEKPILSPLLPQFEAQEELEAPYSFPEIQVPVSTPQSVHIDTTNQTLIQAVSLIEVAPAIEETPVLEPIQVQTFESIETTPVAETQDPKSDTKYRENIFMRIGKFILKIFTEFAKPLPK